MKVLWVGDCHLKIGNLEIAPKFFGGITAVCNLVHPDIVLIAGDLMDTHSIIRSEVMNAWIDYFETVKVPYVALVGNHDKAGHDSPIHALTAFRRLIKVVDGPWQTGNAAFMPYVHTFEEFQKMVGEISDAAQVLFCHSTFAGAQFDNGFYAPEGFSVASVARFKQVVSGHVHKAQKFGNIWYPGSPFANSFNDSGIDKYIWLIDTETLHTEFFDLGLPKYTVLNITADAVLSLLPTLQAQDNYKLVVHGSRAEVTALQDSSEFKKLRRSLKLTVCPEYVDVVAQADRISDAVSPEKMIETYVQSIMKTELDRGVLLDMAVKLLRGENA